MKIVFFETSEEDQKAIVQIMGNTKADLVFIKDKMDESNIEKAADAEVISIFVYSEVKQPQIDRLPKLKMVSTRSTGFDHIDVALCNSKGITVCNVPAYGSRTVAEFAFALILGLSRKTFLAYNQIKEKHDFDFSNFKGFNLSGKTIGIIGTGRIGLNAIQIARGFDMKIIAYDPFPKQDKAVELGFEYLPLNEMLSLSDIVTIHVPYNKDTHHLINKNNINQFKKGALLINTSRGEIVETEALLAGIKEKILSGVGTDVIEGERAYKQEWIRLTSNDEKQKLHTEELRVLLENHMLMDMPEVAITPHIAFFTDEALHEILKTSAENVVSFINDKPINTVSQK